MAGYKQARAGFTQDFGGLDAPSLGLLWRVRATLAEATTAVVQFMPCSRYERDTVGSGAVALGFARAAAALWGRTLLVVAGDADAAGILPDAFVPRLYHQSLGAAALHSMLSGSGAPAGEGSGMFRIVVIDQAASDGGDCAGIAAPLCNGTVLVVQAGRCDVASIRGAIGRVTASGGVVLGAVLASVPAWARAS